MSKLAKTASPKKSAPKSTTLDVEPRRLKTPKYHWYKPHTWKRQQKPSFVRLPKVRYIFRQTVRILKKVPQTVAGITLVYAISVLVFVQGFSAGQDISPIKHTLDSVLVGAGGKIQGALLEMSVLFGGGATTPSSGNFFQLFMLVVCSLAFIRVLRQTQADKLVSIKDAFYAGMYPLVQFMLVAFFVTLQLLPLLVGSFLYRTLLVGGIVVHTWEAILAYAIIVPLIFWSLRMITSSIFALFIVTLPGMSPRAALKSAKQLVRGRRLLIWRKILPLPIVLAIFTVIVVVPFLLFATSLAVWVFYLLSSLWIAFGYTYMYVLYREMIKDE